MSNDIEQIAEARSSGYLRKKLRKAVERRKSTGGIQAGLPTVKVDLYELERILNEHEAAAEIVRAFGVLEGDMPSGWSVKDIQQMAAGWVQMYERHGSIVVNETEILGIMKAVSRTLSDLLQDIQEASKDE